MNLILLFAVVTYVSALGSDRCAWGPSYWCSHVSRAKECGAVNHCMTSVWKKQILKPESSGECMYCQYAFNEVKEILQDKSIQEDISKYVENVCNLFPDPDWKTTCDGIVQEDLPILIQMLDNKIQSQMICAAIGMCSGLEDKYSPYGVLADKKADEQAPNSTYCRDCTKFFKDVQESVVSQETQSELEQIINQAICSNIPSLTSVCQDVVKEILPQFLKFLADQIDPDVTCRLFGFCTTTGHVDVIPVKNVFKNLKKPLTYRSSEECEACEDFLNQVVSTLRDSSTQAVIKSYIESYICNNLGPFSVKCNSLVEEYLPTLFELLVNELDPETICQMVGLCTVPSRTLPLQTVKAVKVEPVALISDGYRDNSLECTACKWVIQEVDNVLRMNETVNVTKGLLDDVCNKLPSGDLKQQCVSFVDEYANMVIKDVADVLDPNKICEDLGVCTAKRSKVSDVKEDIQCDLCVIGVKELQQILANVSSDTVMSYAKQACNFLPMNLSESCFKYVDEYLPLALELLKDTKDPKEICRLGGLCTTAITRTSALARTFALPHKPYMTKPIPENVAQKAASEEVDKLSVSDCDICKIAVTYLKNFIGQNASEAEIEEKLQKLCDLLPSSYSSECIDLVSEYGEEIIKALLNDVDADTLCKDLGLCTVVHGTQLNLQTGILSPVDTLPIVSEKNMKGQDIENTKDSKIQTSEVCRICNTALFVLKTLINNNSTEAEIRQELESLCTNLPTAIQSECHSLVEDYGNQIIHFLVQGIDPDTVCTAIGLCSSTLGKNMISQSGILSPVNTLPIITEGDKKGQDTKTTKDSKIQTSELCEICGTDIYFLKTVIDNNSTEAEIRQGVESLCTYLPTAVQSECQSLIETFGNQIIHLLVHQIDPNTVCTALGLCSSTLGKNMISQSGILSPVNTLPIVTEGDKKVKPAVQGMVECDMCKLVLSAMDEALQQKSTQEGIKEVLLTGCKELPSEIHSECAKLVNKFYMVAINYLLLSQSPASICEELTFCPSKQESLNMADKKLSEGFQDNVDGVECVVCEFVMKEIDSLLGKNASEAEIREALDKVCSILPSTISQECNEFVNKYSAIIIELLLQELSPRMVCSTLGLCNSRSMEGLATMVKILPDKNKVAFDLCRPCKLVISTVGIDFIYNGIDLCGPCELVISTVRSYLNENGTRQEIINYFVGLCSILPDTVTAQCEDVVRQYVPAILDLIEQDISPTQVCQELGFCNATHEMKPMQRLQPSKAMPQKVDNTLYFKSHSKQLGTRKCTYGPSFWCASHENAKLCNAVQHCKKHVWN